MQLAIFLLSLITQIDSIDQIQKKVDEINSSQLNVKEIDANDYYDVLFDGGGTINIFYDKEGVQKVEQEIGVSFGRLTTIIYYVNKMPIKIIDREENFKWRDDETGWDYTKLNQVYQADIFVFDWHQGQGEVVEIGKRIISEGTCSFFEYEPLVDLGKEFKP